MSERVEFGVFKHEGVFSVGVTSSPAWKDRHDADKFAASLNTREEELERLRADNAELKKKLDLREEYDRNIPDPRGYKYLNPDCSFTGCQFLVATHESDRLKAENAAQASKIECLENACRVVANDLRLTRIALNRPHNEKIVRHITANIDQLIAALADKEPK